MQVIYLRAKSLNRMPLGYDTAYFAELDKLQQCLDRLEDKPLKLIASDLWMQLHFKEIPWDSSEWNYSTDGNLTIKPVLLNRQDVFQFSIANATSRQNWHYHRYVFEIYIG